MTLRKALIPALLLAFGLLLGCSESPEELLKKQADQVCACKDFECAMKVLKGPINQKLKKMKGKLSKKGRKEKLRMMKCIFALRAKK